MHFPLSKSNLPPVIAHIQRQREHHRAKTFQEEYRELLKLHAIEFDERYVCGRFSPRRYATDGKMGLANRGLKPTATIMASLRDELRGRATNHRLAELSRRWGGPHERIGTKTTNKPLLPLATFSPTQVGSHFFCNGGWNYGDTRLIMDALGETGCVHSMARLARLVLRGMPHHVTQRGNRRQRTFFN